MKTHSYKRMMLLMQLFVDSSPWLFHRASLVGTCSTSHRLCKRNHRTSQIQSCSGPTTSTSEELEIQQILKGRHKWLGGAYHSTDRCVYGIPSHSGHVICLSPKYTDGHTTYTTNFLPLPSDIAIPKKDKSHQFKWLRGIIANDLLFGIPAWFHGVLTVDLKAWRKWRNDNSECRIAGKGLGDDAIKILPLPNDARGVEKKRWMWHGAALNANKTAIYCIPSNADRVLKVDLIAMKTSYLPIPLSSQLSLTNKWYGGILGNDNAIYGIPYASGSVLRIDANHDTVSLLGEFGTNLYNWHGGILSKGSIYAFPAHSDEVLKIDTAVDLKNNERLKTLPIQRAEYDVDGVERYKWLGGSTGCDGNVYGMPSDASSILRIDTTNNEVRTFGCIQTTSNDNAVQEKNKWQGGVLANDGFIYAVPSNARGILRIDSRPESQTNTSACDPSRVTLVGDLPDAKDKWQGGFLVDGGSIYAIPENCDEVLEIRPQDSLIRFLPIKC